MNSQTIVDMMEKECQSIQELCSDLTEEQWKTATDCPGWSVQDQISHIVGSESSLLGRPRPDHTPKDLSHVKNEFGKMNEIVVDWRRSWPGIKVLDEFKEVFSERLKVLRAMSDEEFNAETQTPIGQGTIKDFLEIRVFDMWVHEQDIRRAINRPGHMDGSVAEHSVGRCFRAMPFVIGKKAQATDGTVVKFEVTGNAGRTMTIKVDGKRANPIDNSTDSPNVLMRMDVETFTCVSCGRWEPERVIKNGKLQLIGDQSLGEKIAAQMNIMM